MVQQCLTDYDCLTFDCYGTLVDWETGIIKAFRTLTDRLADNHEFRSNPGMLLKVFATHEVDIIAKSPRLDYQEVFKKVYEKIAIECGIATPSSTFDTATEMSTFASTIGTWPTFSDTLAVLSRLQKHFKLVILSNVDKKSFDATLAGPLKQVKFDAVYIAEDIGSYKPNPQNFQYLITHCQRDLGVGKTRILHTAYSVPADLRPAGDIGLARCLIERDPNFLGGGSDGADTRSMIEVERREAKRLALGLDFVFPDLKSLADAADIAFQKQRACREEDTS